VPLSPVLAQRRLTQFAARSRPRYGDRLMAFAAAAALPVVLDVRLVHLLRINFFVDVDEPLPWTAESDLLFSPLCTDLGDGLYEIEPTVRGLLLVILRDQGGDERVRDIASLLWAYLHQRPAPWAHEPGLERAQELTALHVLEPAACEQWLSNARDAIDDSAPAERPWFVAMQRKLDAMGALVNRYRNREKLRGLAEEIEAQCRGLASLELPRARSPLREELEGAVRELARINRSVWESNSSEGDVVLSSESTLRSLPGLLAQPRFTLLYGALLRLAFAAQVAEAYGSGWGSRSGVHVLIEGPAGFGQAWLAARLYEERDASSDGLIYLARDLDPGMVYALLNQLPGGMRSRIIRLSPLTEFAATDVQHWTDNFRALLGASLPAFEPASGELPETTLIRIARWLGLDGDAILARVQRAPTIDLLERSTPRDVEPEYPMPRDERRNVIAVIGIDRYQEWPSLANAVHDAHGVREAFRRLGFHAYDSLLDDRATGSAMRVLVTDELAPTLSHDDSLVLFYAGHAHTVTQHFAGGTTVKAGYLIPVDAEHQRVATWLRLDAWLSDVARLPALHILVIIDAAVVLDAVMKWRADGGRHGDLSALRTRRSRQVIVAALHDERASDSGPIPGHSLFTGCLIEALSALADRAEPHVITASELAMHLRQQVSVYSGSHQTPDFGIFELDDRGEMIIPLLVG
jgi:hypothetical protein